MANCEQLHSALAAWVILSQKTLDDVLSISKNIDKYDILSKVNKKYWALSKFEQDKLDFVVMSTVLQWNQAQAYKLSLLDKYKKSFNLTKYDNTIQFIKAVDENSIKTANELYNNYRDIFNAMGIENVTALSASLNEVNKQVKNIVVTDYINRNKIDVKNLYKKAWAKVEYDASKNITNVDVFLNSIKQKVSSIDEKIKSLNNKMLSSTKDTVIKKIEKDIKLLENEKQSYLSSDIIFNSLLSDTKKSDDVVDAYNKYISYNALFGWKTNKEFNSIFKNYKNDTKELEDYMQNISNTESLKDYVLMNSDAFIGSQSLRDSLYKKIDDLSVSNNLSSDTTDKLRWFLDEIEFNTNTELPLSKKLDIIKNNSSLLKKVQAPYINELNVKYWLNININNIIPSRIQSDKVNSIVDNAAEKLMKSWVSKDEAKKFSNSLELYLKSMYSGVDGVQEQPAYIINHIAEWNPNIDLSKAVFYDNSNLYDNLSESEKAMQEWFSMLYKSNNIDLSEIKSVTKGELDEWVANGTIKHIILKNSSASQSPEIAQYIDKWVNTIFPKWQYTYSFTVDNGRLKLVSKNQTAMELLAQDLQNVWFQIDLKTKDIDLWKAIDLINQGRYWDNFERATQILQSIYGDTDLNKIEEDLRLAAKLQPYYDRKIINVDDVRQSLDQYDINYFIEEAKKLANHYSINTDWITLNNVNLWQAKELYLKSKVWGSIENIVQWEADFLNAFGINKILDDVIWTDAVYYDVSKNLQDAWIVLPEWPGKNFYGFIDKYFPTGRLDETANDYTYALATKNDKSFDDTQKAIEDSIAKTKKNYVKVNTDKLPDGANLLFVKDIDDYSDLWYVASNTKWGKQKVNAIWINWFQKRIDSALSKAQSEMEKAIKNGITPEQQLTLKNKLYRTLAILEDELHSEFGWLLSRDRWTTTSFQWDAVRPWSWEWALENLNKWFEDLRGKYKTKFDTIQEDIIQFKKEDKLVSLKNKWYYVENIDGKYIKVTLEDTIQWEIDKLPNSYWNWKKISGRDFKDFSKAEKLDIIEALRKTRSDYIGTLWVYKSAYKALDPKIANALDWYIINPENNLPISMSNVNYSTWLDNPHSFQKDTEIKQKIMNKVKEAISKWSIKWSELNGIVESILIKELWDYSDELVQRYIWNWEYAGISFYTQIPKLPDSVVEQITNIANSGKKELTEKQQNWYNTIKYTDTDGIEKTPNTVYDVNSSYPDILPRVEWESITSIGGRELTQEEKQIVKTNVTNNVDWYVNGVQNSNNFWEWIYSNIRGAAAPIMKTYKRLNNIVNIWDAVTSLSITAQDSLNYIRKISDKKNTAKQFLTWIKSWIDINKARDFAQKYKWYMELSDIEFKDLDSLKKTPTEEAAFNVSKYYRELQKQLVWVTINPQINKSIQDYYLTKFDGLLSDKLTQTKANDIVGRIQTSIRNGNLFDGVFKSKDLKDLNIWFDQSLQDLSDNGRTNFNTLFNASLDTDEYKKVLASLEWVHEQQLFKSNIITRLLNKWATILQAPIWKTFMSFPWTIWTSVLSVPSYITTINKLNKNIKNLWDWSGVSDYIVNNWVLYNSSADAKYLYQSLWNLIPWLFDAKNAVNHENPMLHLFNHLGKAWQLAALKNILWQTLDNGQNIVDALFAHTIKQKSFIMALQDNVTHSFNSFDEYTKFIWNNEIPLAYRRKVYDDVISQANRNQEATINYIPNDLFRNNSYWWSAANILSNVNNAINFRWWLGINAMFNTVNNIMNLWRYVAKYGKNADIDWLAKALSQDKALSMFMSGIAQDSINAIRIAKYWTDSTEDEVTIWDVIDWMQYSSQLLQFLWMSGFARIMKSAFSEWDTVFNILSTISWLVWRSISWWVFIPQLIQAYNSGGMENVNAFLNNWVETASYGALRYYMQEVANGTYYISPNKWFIPSFAGINSNTDIDTYYWSFGIKWRAMLDSYLSGTPWSSAHSVMSSLLSRNKIYQLFAPLQWDKLYVETKKVEESLKQIQDKMDKWLLNLYKELENDKTTEWVRTFNEFKKQLSYRMDIGKSLWTSSERKTIDSYLSNGTTWDENLDAVYKSMKDDGTLITRRDALMNIWWYTKQEWKKIEQERETTRQLVEYIDNMENKPLWYEELQNQILFGESLKIAEAAYKKSKGKWYTMTASDKEYVKTEVTKAFIPRYEYITSNNATWEKTSYWALDVISSVVLKDFIENNSDKFTDLEMSRVVNVKKRKNEDTWVEEIVSYNLKAWYKDKLLTMSQFKDDIAQGKDPIDALKANYWVQSFFPQFNNFEEWGKTIYKPDDIVNTAMAIYFADYIDKQDINNTTKTYQKARMLTNLGKWVMDINSIETQFWEDVANMYRKTFQQTMNDASKIMNSIISNESNKSWWGGMKSIKVPDLTKFADALWKMKAYWENNAWVFKEAKLPSPTKSYEFGIPMSRKQYESNIPEFKLPSYTAKSEDLLPEPKTEKIATIKPTKFKLPKNPKWQKS